MNAVEWFAPLAEGLIRDYLSELRRLGYSGVDRAERLSQSAQRLYRQSDEIRKSDTLTPKGKSDALEAIRQEVSAIRLELAHLKAELTSQALELQAKALAKYPEPTDAELQIALQTLQRDFSPVTVLNLWELGGGYQGFVAHHLLPYTVLNRPTDKQSTERQVAELAGFSVYQSTVNSFINSVETLLGA